MKWIQPNPKQQRFVNLEQATDIHLNNLRIDFYYGSAESCATFEFSTQEETLDAWETVRRLLGYIEHEMVREQSYRNGLWNGKPVVMTPLAVRITPEKAGE